jgi:flagellar FliJ protein
MKSLDTLIRLQKWQLDEKRRQLGDLRRMHADLGASIARLDEDIANEAALARRDASLGATFGAFAQAAAERKQKLVGSLREVESQMALVEGEIADSFAELKKLELTRESREARVRQARARRAQAALDEIGSTMVRRRQGT